MLKLGFLVDGTSVPHDILRIKGVEALASYLIKKYKTFTDFKV